MRIGELARRSGLSTSRIRFYGAKGLLTAVSRKSNGYREYPADALLVWGVIVGAQSTGFSLDEIRQILPADLSNWRRGELMGALRRKIADIEQMEKRLSQSKRQLYALVRKIEGKVRWPGLCRKYQEAAERVRLEWIAVCVENV
jgi:DNA-binding transcriptional MerR regulator